jgi:cytochrome P450
MTSADRSVFDPSAHRRPPGPPPREGLVDSARYYYRFLTDSIGTVKERFDRYGDIYFAPSNGVGLYVLRHPEHLYDVLVRHGGKFSKSHSSLDTLTKVLGHGLLTTDGDRWRRQRRMIQPAFGPKRLAGYAEMMVDETRRGAGHWRDGAEVDLSREMMELTLKVVCRSLFGHDVRGQTDAVAGAMEAFHGLLLTPASIPDWVPLPPRMRAEKALAALDRIIFGMIESRRGGAEAPDPPDLLQMLLEAKDEEGDGGGLDDREIRDQLVTLFLAGHETTSHGLTWAWYLLSQHPEAEAALHAELAEVLGDRPPTYDDYERLAYTRQVFQEAMRLYPPAHVITRLAEEDTTIGDYPVPAGSEVVLWIYWTHHDPRWWPEPEAFRPERFAAGSEEAASRPKLAYVPFGAGARACIGKVFALIEGTLILAELAQRYRFELVPGHPVVAQPRITLAPKHGMKMMVRRR